jgi:hypothetical protein
VRRPERERERHFLLYWKIASDESDAPVHASFVLLPIAVRASELTHTRRSLLPFVIVPGSSGYSVNRTCRCPGRCPPRPHALRPPGEGHWRAACPGGQGHPIPSRVGAGSHRTAGAWPERGACPVPARTTASACRHARLPADPSLPRLPLIHPSHGVFCLYATQALWPQKAVLKLHRTAHVQD